MWYKVQDLQFNITKILPKALRLTGKDVQFLTRKRKFVHGGLFNFFYFSQYPNRQFNQISVNIPLKYSKKAVHRRQIKRALIKTVEELNLVKTPINRKYLKIFVFMNKKSIPELEQKFASLDKKDKIKYIEQSFNFARKKFMQFQSR